MQAFSALPITSDYNPAMQTGRPAKSPRTPFGARIHAARETAGLSQAEVAEHMGLSQNAYAMWERHPVALRPQQIEGLAAFLGVPIEALFGRPTTTRTKPGPVGKARRMFEQVSRLPRDKQRDILYMVDSMVTAHRVKTAKAS